MRNGKIRATNGCKTVNKFTWYDHTLTAKCKMRVELIASRSRIERDPCVFHSFAFIKFIINVPIQCWVCIFNETLSFSKTHLTDIQPHGVFMCVCLWCTSLEEEKTTSEPVMRNKQRVISEHMTIGRILSISRLLLARK